MKRFNLHTHIIDTKQIYGASMKESDTGSFVAFDDHQKELASSHELTIYWAKKAAEYKRERDALLQDLVKIKKDLDESKLQVVQCGTDHLRDINRELDLCSELQKSEKENIKLLKKIAKLKEKLHEQD